MLTSDLNIFLIVLTGSMRGQDCPLLQKLNHLNQAAKSAYSHIMRLFHIEQINYLRTVAVGCLRHVSFPKNGFKKLFYIPQNVHADVRVASNSQDRLWVILFNDVT